MRVSPRILALSALLLAVGTFAFGSAASAQGVDMAEFARQAGFSAQDDLRIVIARLIRTALSFLGVLAVVLVLYGGFSYMTAAGDPQRIDRAKKVLVNAFIGLVIVVTSFSIAQFVITQLMTALGTGGQAGSPPGGGGGFFGDGGGSGAAFTLVSGNAECAAALRNFQPQLVFSQAVGSATVQAGGIAVRVAGGAPIDGSFSVSGRLVTFTPDARCDAPNGDEHCFPADTDIEIVLQANVLKSAAGRPLSCTVTAPCTLSMRTGSGIDTAGPTLAMDAPDDGAGAIVSDVVLLQSRAVDDTGVSVVTFTVDGDEAFAAPLTLSTPDAGSLVGGGADKFFFTDGTQWDTAGFSTNRTYRIAATGADCAGHVASAAPVSLVLRAATCSNGVQDGAETGLDCGGNPASADFCGACVDSPCATNDECASGMCEAGQCVAVARVDEVKAGDGAEGNLITISGIGFGAVPGAVTFLGTGADPGARVTDFSCGGTVAWGDRQVVVRVPAGATDGPILLQTAGDLLADRTDDGFGPFIADFDVNDVVRPGLCGASPDSGARGTSVTLAGTNLGSAQGNASVFFGSTEAASYGAWANASVVAVSPALDARAYGVQAFVGDNVCANDEAVLCRADADCAGSTCLLRRQGSNPVRFAATSASADQAPQVTLIDTGWTACADSTRCATDADCGGAAGSCSAAPNFGPPGQYMTLTGTGFGTGTGQVLLRNVASGDEVVASVDFPAACGSQFWRDTAVTVKVPAAVVVGTAPQFGAYTVTVKRAEDGARSNALDFNLLDPAANPPGPSVCAVNPVSGPSGTAVSFVGENFGGTKGTVLFTSALSVVPLTWADQSVAGAAVPGAAQTGPAVVRSAAGLRANGVPFQVVDCRDEADVCEEGTICCADGTCAAACAVPVPMAHYAYAFSTGPIPRAPRLLYQCDPDAPTPPVPSPSPWEGHSQPSEVCLNAAVSGTFDMPIDPATITVASVRVDKCESSLGNPCGTRTPVAGSVAPNALGFMWTPGALLEPDALYEVTLLGGDAAGAIASLGGTLPSTPLLRDETWRFRTAPAGTTCVVGDVSMSPDRFTATEQGEEVDYQSIPVANGCVTLSCVGTTFDWSAQPSRATLASGSVTDSCNNVATALNETNPGSPVVVTATAQTVGSPSGAGDLTINFTDPQVVSHSPACEEACVNSAIVGVFNIPMEAGDVEAPGAVRIQRCVNALCASSLAPVAGTAVYDQADIEAPRFTVSDAVLQPDMYYRVTVSGAIRSQSGIPLSAAIQPELRFGTDVSWVFKTKDSPVTCAIDRIDVAPSNATATFVGERTEFRARSFGAPDSCSANGQELVPGLFTWAPWTSVDAPDTVASPATVKAAQMLGNGAITLGTPFLPAGCTSTCLSTGTILTTASPLCGRGGVQVGEDCDGGAGCSAVTCERVGSNRTTDTVPGTCGNGTVEVGEECDDVNATDGDGCSARCLNEGSEAVGGFARCGNGTVDHAPTLGGEDCDDGNARSGDGCSSVCLNEGTLQAAAGIAICGDGVITAPAETCDGGNATDGDGCSARCLREGMHGGIDQCGNGTVERNSASGGEDCDDGGRVDGDGCSARCLLEGSSIRYATASFCGDGVTGIGEAPAGSNNACELAVAGRTSVGAYAVSQASIDAPREIDGDAKEAVATITATAGTPARTGTARLAVQCACENDAMCGATGTLGCGAGSCCFQRPEVHSVLPPNGDSNVCRNALLRVEFTKPMDPKSFDRTVAGGAAEPQLYVELTAIGGVPVTAATCPHGPLASSAGSLFERAWGGIKAFFGRPASAQGAGTRCLVPVTPQAEAGGAGEFVTLALREPLAANGAYRLAVNGDADLADAVPAGVLSVDGVSMAAGGGSTFTTGTDICAVDAVLVADLGRVESLDPNAVTPKSIGLFTKAGELHRIQATANAVRNGAPQPIQPTPGYAWGWSFATSIPGPDGDVIASQPSAPAAPLTAATLAFDARALERDGEESALAIATITADTLLTPSTTGREVVGEAPLIVLLCENPWPALDGSQGPFPYVEDEAPNPSNYSFFYCRDAGEPGTDDDLPGLNIQPTASSPVAGILKETLYPVEKASAGIGVRVIKNERYLPPDLWYREQGFGGSPQSTELDGYQAVRDGNTIYVAAANQTGEIYPNIYVFSVSQGAPPEAALVLDQVAGHFSFNANTDAVSDVNLCRENGGNYAKTEAGAFVTCSWDGDCAAGQFCDAEKAKLRRDMRRLTDMVRVQRVLETFGNANAHCSITRNQRCDPRFPACPGAEQCVRGVPELGEGTFIRTFDTSAWPSWDATLGAALGTTLPKDPLNEFFQCPQGADPATCYNASSGQFQCSRGSHVYGFQSSGGETYILSTVLEHAEAAWGFPLDADLNDNATLRAEYQPRLPNL